MGSRASDATGGGVPDGSPEAATADALPSPAGAGDSPLDAPGADQDRGAPVPGPDDPARGATAAPAVAAGRPWPDRYDALAERWSRDHARAPATEQHRPIDKQ